MRQFDIISCNLDPTIGYEISKTRPCVIISPDEMNAHLKTVIIAPVTSIERKLPTRITISKTDDNHLKQDSYIALDQLKTVDKNRLLQPAFGHLTDREAQMTSKVLYEMFSI